MPHGLVESLILAADAEGNIHFNFRLREGQSVKVTAGPFANLIGSLEKLDERGRVRVLLELMGSHGTCGTARTLDSSELVGWIGANFVSYRRQQQCRRVFLRNLSEGAGHPRARPNRPTPCNRRLSRNGRSIGPLELPELSSVEVRALPQRRSVL